MNDKVMKNLTSMLATALAIAGELSDELTRRTGGTAWLDELEPRLQQIVKNGDPGDRASTEDEAIFYEAGFAALRLIIGDVRSKADRDGLANNSDEGSAEPNG